MIVRMKYAKGGNSVYIGHLEMTKLFERAFRRAGVQVCYTEGFNPTVRLNFAAPLSVGIESVCEVAEVEIADESAHAFGRVEFPAGVSLLEYRAVEKEKPLMSRLAYAEFEITPFSSSPVASSSQLPAPEFPVPAFPAPAFPAPESSLPASARAASSSAEPSDTPRKEIFLPAAASGAPSFTGRVNAFLHAEEVLFEKRTKKGTRTANMREFVVDLRWEEERRVCTALLLSGNAGALNPYVLAERLFPGTSVRIVRTALLDEERRDLY